MAKRRSEKAAKRKAKRASRLAQGFDNQGRKSAYARKREVQLTEVDA